jgi:hypothetical protein
MKAKLPELKRELEGLPQPQLVRLCLRLAKYKVETKELLDYLLWSSEDPIQYAHEFKTDVLLPFDSVFTGSYVFTKSLRKSLRLIAKYTRFTGSKQGECELLLAFVEAFFQHYQRGFHSTANSKIIFRCLKKAAANIIKLHEDIQADYTENFNNLLRQAILKFGNETQGEFSYF